jgi:hypothetical protein
MKVPRQRAWSNLGAGILVALALGACGTLPAPPIKCKTDPVAHSGLVPSLQRQLKERDQRIEELESRLGALKVIDQDIEKQRKYNQPPATLTPAN